MKNMLVSNYFNQDIQCADGETSAPLPDLATLKK